MLQINHHFSKLVISCFLVLGCFYANASYKVYEAELNESDWQFSGNALGCKLSHSVPLYGQAFFAKQAGTKQPLEFKLSYKRQPITAVKIASIQSLSPSWLPKQRARNLGSTKIHSGDHIFQGADTASWKLLNELEIGRFPTFRYQSFDTIQDQVAVSLSAVGFKQPYDEFLNCLSGLVPYKLNELAKMTLRFDFAKHSVKEIYQNKLKALAAYIRFDPKLEVVFISGYTDSKGSRNYNHKLSERRIAAVQELLTLQGADPTRFKILPYGERNPIASNRKASGRALNRRVYIRVSQQ